MSTITQARPVRHHGHDVSQEARDARGRWSATAESHAIDTKGHRNPVSSLNRHLRGLSAPPLAHLLDGVHWYSGSSGGFPDLPDYKVDLSGDVPRVYRPLHPLDDLYHMGKIEYSRHVKPYLDQLPASERETLHRLAYGNIPAGWGHDPAYVEHLRHWSTGSSLVDENGLPYRLFHGTGAVFHSFDPVKRGTSTRYPDAKLGYFFAGSPEDAGFFAFYGMTRADRSKDTPNVMPVHVRLRKPLVVVDKSGRMDSRLLQRAIEYARSHNYDGVVAYQDKFPVDFSDAELGRPVASLRTAVLQRVPAWSGEHIRLPYSGRMSVVALDNRDIKSAIGNIGTFDVSADMGKSAGVTLLLEKSRNKASLKESGSKRKYKPGQKIYYQHPNYGGQTRCGTVLAAGRDGCTVLHLDSGHEERVRYHHVLPQKPKSDMHKSELQKGLPDSNKPENKKAQQSEQQYKVRNTQQWKPPVVPLPYDVGHAVEYRRPDMPEPRIGKIIGVGRDGALLSLSNGAQHKVRWPDVQRRVNALVPPDQHGDAIQALQEMGLPMDTSNALLASGLSSKADKSATERLAVLADDGVPIDMKKVVEAHPDSVKRLLSYLTSQDNNATLGKT